MYNWFLGNTKKIIYFGQKDEHKKVGTKLLHMVPCAQTVTMESVNVESDMNLPSKSRALRKINFIALFGACTTATHGQALEMGQPYIRFT